MNTKSVNVKILHKFFVELYFYNLKENSNVSISDFKSGGRKVLYELFFLKYNIMAKYLKTLKRANTKTQRMRIYTCIRKSVCLFYLYIK